MDQKTLVSALASMSTVTETKSVRFGTSVRVQEYAITLGCNPGGNIGGPPITIDWDVLYSETVSLKAYERARRPLIRKSKQERTRLLMEQGFMEDTLLQAEQLMAEIRNSRVESSFDEEDLSNSFCSVKSDDSGNRENAIRQVNDVNIAGLCADYNLIQRSVTGQKAMMMFQKRRVVR